MHGGITDLRGSEDEDAVKVSGAKNLESKTYTIITLQAPKIALIKDRFIFMARLTTARNARSDVHATTRYTPASRVNGFDG